MNFTYPKYDKIDQIAHGRTNDVLTEGTLVLEGGAYRALYTPGSTSAMSSAVRPARCPASAMWPGKSAGVPAST